ncbi:H+-transporting ATPase [Geosmithia morbida]|uniref:Plasma membrane ATPase n=1 Tax=Geosmithia morbida TaxID=1094350 RepID=A0A9P4YWE0_9HYPO|nr:H+-transporting ATPase [Geosmithia morbida]KAF4124326.1 H+-transporting ATPase [Geosmithia morbida]
MLSRLHHRKPHGGQVDPEAGESGGSSSNQGGPGVGDGGLNGTNNMVDEKLGEYPALDRYISIYREEEKPQDDTQGKKRKKPWWKFWQFQSDEEEPVAADQGVPDHWIETDIHRGISTNQIPERRKLTGWNELSAEKENLFTKFLSFFTGPILYVMELAALLAVGLGDWIDFGVIVGILALNAFVGFYQEKQAADVVASLKGDIAMRCTVVRDGQEQNILARELVIGDVVIVGEGSTVPADACLICDADRPEDQEVYKRLRAEDKLGRSDDDEGDDSPEDEGGGSTHAKSPEDKPARRGSVYVMMQHRNRPLVAVDQSAITGESLAVDKYMGDTIYYTTGCKRGRSYAVVTATAKRSFVGRTADLVQGAKDQGHFKAVMDKIGTTLLILVMFWILAAWIGGFFRNIPVTEPGSQNLFHYALILMIIGVPVGLPVVTTTTLAVGAAYLAKQKAIVQKLTAIESLAGVDILCSDKTGTLTANKLSMREPWVSEGQDVNWMMAVAAMASSHNLKSLDPIDKVTILSLKRYPQAREILQNGWTTDKFTPFDPVSKRITAEVHLGSDRYTCAKGAPRAVLRLTNCSEEAGDLYNDKAQEFARRGFRSLGVAYRKNDEPWVLLGLLSMFDPPREDTAQTIIEAFHLGVPVKMLTGDALAIAKETCKMLSLGSKVYNSERLIHGNVAGSVQHDLVERADGFAEVFPEHKYTVVEMLQQRGHLTAMTGDGVNDAPSLKKADCGIAVEGASEAAQAASDIVFLAPGLSTIVLAIKTSRQIFQRMKSYIQYRIALCLHLEIYLTLSMIIINETIRADLIVFIALFADLATVAVAYDNAHWEPRPVEWQLPKIWVVSVVLGILLAIGTWVMRATMFLDDGGIIKNFGSIQEVLFLQVSLTENWLIFVTRGGKTWPSWQLILAILGVDIIATLFCLFGWLSGTGQRTSPPGAFDGRHDGWTDVVTVVLIWLYSFGVTIIIAIVYLVLNNISWLDNLGRKNRSKKDTAIEDALVRLQKLAIEQETDSSGRTRYFIAEKAGEDEDDL